MNNPIRYSDPSGHMIMIEDNFFVRDDRKTGNFVLINNVGKGKLFANPVEQAAANVLLNKNPKYFAAMPSRSPGFVIGATFEGAGEKIGEDLGSYYTDFINLTNMAWVGFAGTRYSASYTTNTTPKTVQNDALGDPDYPGTGYKTPKLSEYIDKWDKSTFPNRISSINYHFNKHSNLWTTEMEYTQAAIDFYQTNIDLARPINLRTGEMGVKISTEQYFGIYTNDGRIVSFGPR